MEQVSSGRAGGFTVAGTSQEPNCNRWKQKTRATSRTPKANQGKLPKLSNLYCLPGRARFSRTPNVLSLKLEYQIVRPSQGFGRRSYAIGRALAFVVVFDEGTDGIFQLVGGLMRSSAELLFGQRSKPAFNNVEPVHRGGREVQVQAQSFQQPVADQLLLVRAVVVMISCISSSGGMFLSIVSRKMRNFTERWRRRVRPINAPILVPSTANKMVGPRRALSCMLRSIWPGLMGSRGAVLSKACIWLFSSTHRTRALRRGQVQTYDIAYLFHEEPILR